jgi:hypothetical protein
MTLKEIGEMMNISRERVRQIECQAKERLRKMFARRRMVKAPDKRLRPPGGHPDGEAFDPADGLSGPPFARPGCRDGGDSLS